MDSKYTNFKARDNTQKNKSDKRWLIIGAIILLVLLAYVGITSVYTLVGQRIMSENIDAVLSNPDGDYHFAEGKIYYASPCIGSVEHSINGIIPTGTEYYYVIFSKDETACMVVKAPDDWDMDNFPDFYNSNGLELSGQIKKMDYHARNFFSSYIQSRKLTGLKYSGAMYIDLTAEKHAYFGVVGFVLILAGSVICFLAAKKKITNSYVIIAGALGIFAGIIFFIIYL